MVSSSNLTGIDQVVLGTLLGTSMGMFPKRHLAEKVGELKLTCLNSGLAFSYALRYCQKKSLLGQESFLAQHLALAVLTIGVASTLGMDDLLAAFAAGKWTLYHDNTAISHSSSRKRGFMGR